MGQPRDVFPRVTDIIWNGVCQPRDAFKETCTEQTVHGMVALLSYWMAEIGCVNMSRGCSGSLGTWDHHAWPTRSEERSQRRIGLAHDTG